MTLGSETIELQPFKNWGQLDAYKWRVQGKLPGTPPGLEVTLEHVKVGGETVAIGDAEGCSKLERAFNEWLTLEKNNLELARKKQQSRATVATSVSSENQQQAFHFRVELDKRGQVHINCLRGAETLTSVGLTVQGFNGLFSQGLMRKPRALEVGALHDWVTLDGELCSFEHGNNDTAKLEHLLNERYVPVNALGQGKDVLIFANAASPTGFDIQFPVTIGGVAESRRRTLNDAALELLQEPARCGLLQPGLIIKLSPPTFIFKRKTADGGEAYLEKGEADTVRVMGDDGREQLIDLSRPVNYSHLSVVELTAVFNHPAVNRHGKVSLAPKDDEKPEERTSVSNVAVELPVSPRPAAVENKIEIVSPSAPAPPPAPEQSKPLAPVVTEPKVEGAPQTAETRAQEPLPRPNAWLQEILSQAPIRFDWFACLVYFKIAEHFSNSREGMLGPSKCWSVALTDITDISDPDYVGIFLTEKGGIGYLGLGRLARFHRGVVFLGTPGSVLEGININLVAVGLDSLGCPVFIVTDDYQSKFGVPNKTVAQELIKLNEAGASMLSIHEVLENPRPLDIVWTVPVGQPNPNEPQAVVNQRPAIQVP
jgi:hypothetical protein